ncbi:DUF3127 domain-containing protein [Pseudomaricurvus alkylphenolicus]|uniref:DUF3127 domain-containing protein n=1 Tax=Pseudomaricurvus alkylphenolicus TaxID=1306991 RepID=UPI001422B38D|nr:DUF3127 domain-containing protein [Pseudomaricurvus alkylphenolicus]NIB41392.1 DUF3127 domain-containing protein [Pseudomaricurvus alkylphenolicus]
MSQSFQTQGEIHSIGETTEYGKNGFTKREFVIKLTGPDENSSYPNYIALELIKDKCALLDSYNIGDEIQVHFNLSGRLWSGGGKGEKCFTSLQAWRIEGVSAGANAGMPDYGNEPAPDYGNLPPAGSAYDDDVPF